MRDRLILSLSPLRGSLRKHGGVVSATEMFLARTNDERRDALILALGMPDRHHMAASVNGRVYGLSRGTSFFLFRCRPDHARRAPMASKKKRQRRSRRGASSQARAHQHGHQQALRAPESARHLFSGSRGCRPLARPGSAPQGEDRCQARPGRPRRPPSPSLMNRKIGRGIFRAVTVQAPLPAVREASHGYHN